MFAQRTIRAFLAYGLAASLTLAVGPAMATPAFFDGVPPEGWFWYHVQPPPTKPEPKPKPKPPVVIAPAPVQPPATKTTPQPAFGSAAWIRENLPKYRDRAIDHPTRENVLAYMFLQRLTMDKSQRFADAVEAAVKTTPVLDEVTRRPTSSLGARLATERASDAKDRLMHNLSKQVGLWFFYSKDCTACASQASILAGVHEIYGLPITAISMDGSAPPAPFKNCKRDEGQAKRLSVAMPLAMYLANPKTKQVVAIAQGLLARDQIVSRVLLSAHTAGWLPDTEYNRTRPMRTNNLLTAKLGGEEGQTRSAEATNVPVSPDEILRRLHVNAAERLLEH